MNTETKTPDNTISTTEATEKKPLTVLERQIEMDNWPVKWAGRDSDGNLWLKHTVYRVKLAPAPMFGQNIKAFGFEVASAIAENTETPDHDFGACYIRERSLRQESDGQWYVDLTVDTTRARYSNVKTRLVNAETGEPLLDENGEELVREAPRKESWITCHLSMLEPYPSHHLDAEYYQSDRRTVAAVRLARTGVKVASEKKDSKPKATRQRVMTRAQLAAMAMAGIDL